MHFTLLDYKVGFDYLVSFRTILKLEEDDS